MTVKEAHKKLSELLNAGYGQKDIFIYHPKTASHIAEIKGETGGYTGDPLFVAFIPEEIYHDRPKSS